MPLGLEMPVPEDVFACHLQKQTERLDCNYPVAFGLKDTVIQVHRAERRHGNWSSKLTEDFFPVRIVRSFWMCLLSATQVVLSLVRCQNGPSNNAKSTTWSSSSWNSGKSWNAWILVFEDSFCCQKTSPGTFVFPRMTARQSRSRIAGLRISGRVAETGSDA